MPHQNIIDMLKSLSPGDTVKNFTIDLDSTDEPIVLDHITFENCQLRWDQLSNATLRGVVFSNCTGTIALSHITAEGGLFVTDSPMLRIDLDLSEIKGGMQIAWTKKAPPHTAIITMYKCVIDKLTVVNYSFTVWNMGECKIKKFFVKNCELRRAFWSNNRLGKISLDNVNFIDSNLAKQTLARMVNSAHVNFTQCVLPARALMKNPAVSIRDCSAQLKDTEQGEIIKRKV